jgi:predicted phage replisome organizer
MKSTGDDPMSEVKWIKIYTSMINNKKIKRIRRMPEGNNIILIWVFLLAQAGESNKDGGLFITDTIPFTIEDLSEEFDFSMDVIRLSLITLERFQMIEIFEEVIYIKNWQEYQNIEGMEKIREQTRLRVQKHRDKRKELMESHECQYCGGKATGYDHIIAIARGGIDEDSNKIPCCIDCNRIKNDKPLVDFLNANRDRIKDEIVLNNTKLSKHIYLCNVTDRYHVTQCNATEEEIDKEIEIKDIDKKKSKKSSFNELILKYTQNEEFISTLNDFIDMRKTIKKPMTEKALDLILKKLDKLSNDENEKIAILNQSILNSWQGIFELKDKSAINESNKTQTGAYKPFTFD